MFSLESLQIEGSVLVAEPVTDCCQCCDKENEHFEKGCRKTNMLIFIPVLVLTKHKWKLNFYHILAFIVKTVTFTNVLNINN